MTDGKAGKVQTKGTYTLTEMGKRQLEVAKDLFDRGLISFPDFVGSIESMQWQRPMPRWNTATTATTTTTNDRVSLYAKSITAVHEDDMLSLVPMIGVHNENKDMPLNMKSKPLCLPTWPLPSSSSENKEEVATTTNPFNDTEDYYHKLNEATDEWSAEEWNNWKIDAHLLRPQSTPQDEQARRAVGLPVYGWYCTTCARAFDYPSSLCAHEWYPRNYSFDDVD